MNLNHGRVTGILREIKQLPNGRRLANAGCGGGRHENSTHVGHTCRRAGSGSQAEPLELVRTAVRRWACLALGALATNRAIAALVDALADSDEDIRTYASFGIAKAAEVRADVEIGVQYS